MGIKQSTPIPNHLFDECLPKLKPAELKVLLVILRQTIGWQKNEDWIATCQFISKTGCSRRAISSAIKALIAQGLIYVTDGHQVCVNNVEDRRGKGRLFFRPTISPQQKVHTPVQYVPVTCASSALVTAKKLHITKDTLTKETSTNRSYAEKTRRELIAMGILP
jgi:phage replication O-like protein O